MPFFPRTWIGRLLWPFFLGVGFYIYYAQGLYEHIGQIYNAYYYSVEQRYRLSSMNKCVKTYIRLPLMLSSFTSQPVYIEIEHDYTAPLNKEVIFIFRSHSNNSEKGTFALFCQSPGSWTTCRRVVSIVYNPNEGKKDLTLHLISTGQKIKDNRVFIKLEVIFWDDDGKRRSLDLVSNQAETCASAATIYNSEDLLLEIKIASTPQERAQVFARMVIQYLLLPPWANIVLPAVITYIIVLIEILWQRLTKA